MNTMNKTIDFLLNWIFEISLLVWNLYYLILGYSDNTISPKSYSISVSCFVVFVMGILSLIRIRKIEKRIKELEEAKK